MPIRLLFGDLPATAGAESMFLGVGQAAGVAGVVGASPNLFPCNLVEIGSER